MTMPSMVELGPELTLHLRPVLDLSDDTFLALCALNPDLRLELTAEGEIVIMPPTGGETGNRCIAIAATVYLWSRADGTGHAFGSSTGFRLPTGAIRSPDASWVRRDRLEAVPREARAKFLPLCPDFVIELRSPSDRLAYVQAKMDEYMANGARLGWLVDPVERTVHVYRPDSPPALLVAPERLSGEPELPGLSLELAEIWQPLV